MKYEFVMYNPDGRDYYQLMLKIYHSDDSSFYSNSTSASSIGSFVGLYGNNAIEHKAKPYNGVVVVKGRSTSAGRLLFTNKEDGERFIQEVLEPTYIMNQITK
jgi:hypothetical protein